MAASPGSAACAPSAPRALGAPATLIRFQRPRPRRQLLPVATNRFPNHKPLSSSSSSSSSSSFPRQQIALSRAADTTGGEQPRESGGGRRRPPLPPSAVTYRASISTDLPIYEPPWASFDDYLEDRPRVFRALFPDKRRSQRLNDEEWRIRMLPLQFLLLSVNPVVVMRLRCGSSAPSHGNGNGSPSSVPRGGVTRVLELQATRWELQGLDSVHMPSHFELDVQGSLYTDRRGGGGGGGGGGRSRLKGHLAMSISLVLPPVLALVPAEVLRSVAESLLKRLVERLKKEVDVNLLADYRNFSKEMAQRQQQQQIPATNRTGSN